MTSFGTLTKLYFNFADRRVKKQIARSYGVPQHEILESWMKAVNTLRNACAHHNRIWNRIMPVMPQIPTTLGNPWISQRPTTSNRLYAVFCCLVYWLNSFRPNNTLVHDFKNLLINIPMWTLLPWASHIIGKINLCGDNISTAQSCYISAD